MIQMNFMARKLIIHIRRATCISSYEDLKAHFQISTLEKSFFLILIFSDIGKSCRSSDFSSVF